MVPSDSQMTQTHFAFLLWKRAREAQPAEIQGTMESPTRAGEQTQQQSYKHLNLFIMPDLFSHVNCQEWDLKGVDEGDLQTKVISRTSYCTSPNMLLPSHLLSCSSLQSTQQLLAQGNSNKTFHGSVNLLMQLNCWK